MSHYTANLRDIEFCLFDLLERENVMGRSIYKDMDRPTAMGMLEEIKRLAENDLAASFVEGDRLGTTFDKETGSLTLPYFFRQDIARSPLAGVFHEKDYIIMFLLLLACFLCAI